MHIQVLHVNMQSITEILSILPKGKFYQSLENRNFQNMTAHEALNLRWRHLNKFISRYYFCCSFVFVSSLCLLQVSCSCHIFEIPLP